MHKRVATAVFAVLLAGLQYRLWVADGGVAHTHRLKAVAETARQELDAVRLRNAALDAEVLDLNSGKAAIEARARTTLGMIKPDETFYLVVE
jgi:cell division protein FtsB